MYTLGPFGLSAPVQINPNTGQNAQPIIAIVIQNNSASVLTIQNGLINDYIGPFGPYLIQYSQPNPSPSIINVTPSPETASGQLLATVYTLGDAIPSTSFGAIQESVALSQSDSGITHNFVVPGPNVFHTAAPNMDFGWHLGTITFNTGFSGSAANSFYTVVITGDTSGGTFVNQQIYVASATNAPPIPMDIVIGEPFTVTVTGFNSLVGGVEVTFPIRQVLLIP